MINTQVARLVERPVRAFTAGAVFADLFILRTLDLELCTWRSLPFFRFYLTFQVTPLRFSAFAQLALGLCWCPLGCFMPPATKRRCSVSEGRLVMVHTLRRGLGTSAHATKAIYLAP